LESQQEAVSCVQKLPDNALRVDVVRYALTAYRNPLCGKR
jgi:hypothetical protein